MTWHAVPVPWRAPAPLPPTPPHDAQSLLQAHARALMRALGRPLSGGNVIESLDDPAELQHALDGARDHVNFDGDPGFGARRAQVLSTRDERAVTLNLLRAGWLARLRGERALLLVVDGRMAFVGDRHAPLRIEGPAVAELQRRFLRRWQDADRVALPAARYFPPLPPAGEQRLGVAVDAGALDAALRAAVAQSQRRVVLDAAHARALRRELRDAAARGVAVQPVPALPAVRGAMVVDGVWALPARGGVVVLDRAFAASVERRLLS